MLSAVDVVNAAHAGGFPDGELVTAVAIAYAESSWDPNATHHNSDGSTDYGLWQINSVHNFPELTNGQWKDPATNARLAYQVYQGQGWGAWSTHNPTSDPIGYARYIGEIPYAQAAVKSANLSSAVGAAVGAAGTANSSLSLLKEPLAVLNFLEQGSTWVRFSKLAIGGLIIVAAAFVVIQGVVAPASVQAAGSLVTGAGRVKNIAASAKNVRG